MSVYPDYRSGLSDSPETASDTGGNPGFAARVSNGGGHHTKTVPVATSLELSQFSVGNNIDFDVQFHRMGDEIIIQANTSIATRQRLGLGVEEVFRRLADEWLEETGDSSFISKKVTHPTYYQIIGLGPGAVPLLLRELRREPAYWFWALHSITRENPVRPGANFSEAVEDWLTWGRARGLID